MTDAKTYWKRIDYALEQKNLTVTEMANAIGYKRETIYYQKRKNQFPKVKQMEAIEKFIGFNPLEEENKYAINSEFVEFIPYLEKAEDWKIRAIRELLGMPDKKTEVEVV